MSQAGRQHPQTDDELLEYARTLSNWGRWGPDDQRGALNLITPTKIVRAAGLVREGVAISAARPLDTAAAADNAWPVVHLMTGAGVDPGAGGSGDYLALRFHGFAHTHVDALCHIFFDGHVYNGFDQRLVTAQGAGAGSILAAEHGIVSRGVLLDVPLVRGKEWLEPGEAVFPEDLEAAETAAAVRVEDGDVLVLYTGRWLRRERLGPWGIDKAGLAGLHGACLPWLHERGVAAIACDGVSDVIPSGFSKFDLPVHRIGIPIIGLYLLDNCGLEELAQACRARSRWEFLFLVAPLRLPGGTGSPVNPLAVF